MRMGWRNQDMRNWSGSSFPSAPDECSRMYGMYKNRSVVCYRRAATSLNEGGDQGQKDRFYTLPSCNPLEIQAWFQRTTNRKWHMAMGYQMVM